MVHLATKVRWFAIAIAVCFVVAWVARPPSLRKKLEADGVFFTSKGRDDTRGSSGNISSKAGFYEIPKCGESELIKLLKKHGFSDRFGKSTSSTTDYKGTVTVSEERVLTRGIYFKPLFDYDRAWIIRIRGKTTVVIDPDPN